MDKLPDSLYDTFRPFPKEQVNQTAKKVHDEVFSRTDCLACGNCCKSAPPIVKQSDIKRIARFLNTSPKQFKRKYVIEDFNGELSFDRIPCTFLGEDNVCTIYEVRPDACRDYPHTRSGKFTERLRIHEKNISICPAVEEIITIMEAKLAEDLENTDN